MTPEEPPAHPTPVPLPPPVDFSATKYPLDRAHLFDPFWKSETVYGESVALLKEEDSEPPSGTLLFAPRQILQVRSSDGNTLYTEGRDYLIDKVRRRLLLAPGSRIPFIRRADLYKRKGEPRSIPHKADDPETNLLYQEGWFRSIQVEVDYLREEPWTGYTPAFAGTHIPRTIARIESGAPLNICVTGDSIATGANASDDTPPYMPGFVPLTGFALRQRCRGKISLTNLARGGTQATDGLDKVPETVAANPDLVIIAFGMNDVSRRQPITYSNNIGAIIDGIRRALPEAELILLSSILANPEWNWSPADQFLPHRDALMTLFCPGIAFADMTQLWADIMREKRYLDLTGNGINHPNDFGQRLYAQALLALLVR